MPFCTQCGSPLDENAAFCKSCGAAVAREDAVKPGAAPPTAKTGAPATTGEGPPPGAPPVSKNGKGGRIAIVSIVGLLLIAAIVVLVGGLVWPGWFKSDDGPGGVTKEYINKVAEKKYREAYELLSSGDKQAFDFDSFKSFCKADPAPDEYTLEIISEKIDGDEATVTIRVDDDESELNLVREDGKWRLSLLGISGELKDQVKVTSRTPGGVAKQYFSAMLSSDFRTAYDLLIQENRDALPFEEFEKTVSESKPPGDFKSLEAYILAEEIDGDTAVVTYIITRTEGTVTLMKEEGEWRIDATSM